MDSLASIGWEVIDRITFGGFRGPSPHGIGIAVGYLAGSWWLLREGDKRGLREDDISTVLLRALVGAILGARFFYVLAHFSEFERPVDMLKIWEGGISLIGGIFGAIMLAYPYMRKAKMGFLRTMDSAAIGLAFGIVFGRVGDLIIGDHIGKPTSWLLAFKYEGGPLSGSDCTTVVDVCRQVLSDGSYQIVSPSGAELHRATGELLQSGIGVHQTALYDFISTFLLFGLLLWLSKRPRHQGVLIATFGLWYGVVRIVTDYLRVDKRFFGLTGSQWASAAVAAICAFVLVKWARQGRVEPAVEAAGVGAVPGGPGGTLSAGVDQIERDPEPETEPEPEPEPEREPHVIPSEPAEPVAEPSVPDAEPQRELEPVPEPAPPAAPASPQSVTSFTPPPDPTRR